MMPAAPNPDLPTFLELARPGRIVPVWLEFSFDIDTAVTAYAKLREGPFGFLLESVVGGERWARYSFIGSAPRAAWKVEGDRISTWNEERGWRPTGTTDDPFAAFEAWIRRHEPVDMPGLPRFWGGAVGFFAYDMVRWLERVGEAPPRDIDLPDACFLATDRILILDNLRNRAVAVQAVPIAEREAADRRASYDRAVVALRGWIERLAGPSGLRPVSLARGREVKAKSNRGREDFEEAVRRIREYIRSGDAYQVVVSQRLEAPMPTAPLNVYRALRMLNPSPYLFLLELDGIELIGSSPEALVRVEDGRITVRPIAGTRPRGGTRTEDESLARELLADQKERAEHLMLVDLGRNDVGRVARGGSVRVPEFMKIERYSHVMHLVSEVAGSLRPGLGAVDALRACFPAGTLTGAPKVRAMQIIDELEPTRRGPYGGAVGYASYGATSLDMAIAIRTIVARGGRAYAQAGAGVVHDSVPAREWEETRDKARVLLRALAVEDDGSGVGPRRGLARAP